VFQEANVRRKKLEAALKEADKVGGFTASFAAAVVQAGAARK